MSDPDTPRVALVTGGASGIGLATTLRLLGDGWSVLVADRNADAGADAVRGAEEAGHAGRVALAACDVTREDDVAGAVAATVERFGAIGAMVNNAGYPGVIGSIMEIDAEHWDATFAVLCRAVFLGTKHAALAMRAAGHGGAIVNIASVAGLSGGVGPQAYSAAKAAVVNLTQTTAVELAELRIRVNAVAPGPVLTPILGTRGDRQERMAELLRTTQPWPDAGMPEDIADAVAFLASPQARFITGETLVVDGGQTAAGPLEAMNRLWNPRAAGLAGGRGSSGQPNEMPRPG